MKTPEELQNYFMQSKKGKGNYLPLVDFIKEIQKDAYNQAIEDSKLKIKYDVYHVEIETPTNNAGYTSRKNEEFVDFLMSYEDSILKLKIK